MPAAVTTMSPLALARLRARKAHRAARMADARTAATWDRVFAETLLAIEGQPAERATIMLVRCAILLEVATDRLGWPGTIRGYAGR